MEWTGLNELREKFLCFFESKDHLIIQSFSLVPHDDKSLLLINAGMAPLKKYFTGELTPPNTRVADCQKCIRTPDIERVGKTSRHGTYFEMLGNFSFGDYFKREAINLAWEFCTEIIKMPKNKLHISVYEEDDETYAIWKNEIGIDESHIAKLGKEDNFWELGAGPCGPCSELYFNRGEKYGCGSPDCKVGCDCDRYIEIWNLVFTQFESDGNGNYKDLEKPNIDTGMGLERLACISQGVDNLFEVDTIRNIMNHAVNIAGVKYRESNKNDVSLRVITDHIRSTTFLIGDGVMPSNEGRGYVLRRLLRRAARHGRLLGINNPFLFDLCETVINENKAAYPNLFEKRDFIKKVVYNEEENFGKTIDLGLQMLDRMIETIDGNTLSGQAAFKLSDTFGFPIDLTKEILAERELNVDEIGFSSLVLEQRERARNARKNAGSDGWKDTGLVSKGMKATEFCGFSKIANDSEIEAIIIDGKRCEYLENGVNAAIVLRSTTFYAESGGQTGDTGEITKDSTVFEVNATTKTSDGVIFHHGAIIHGEGLGRGDAVKAEVDKERREATARNHTAAHLLHSALRKLLGNHVEQAGQLVGQNLMRFDFTYQSALNSDEIEKLERAVNSIILEALPITTEEMTIDVARSLGAIALFGEKYGKVVRAVKAENYSIELCGGTHVDNTAKLGLFKIISESSVASGVRRIEGVTGYGTLDFMNANETLIKKTATAMKLGNVQEIIQRADALMTELKNKDKEISKYNAALSRLKAESLLKEVKFIGGIKLVSAVVQDTTPDAIRLMCDTIKASDNKMVVLLAGTNIDKNNLSFAAACAQEAVNAGAHAGNIIKAVAKIAGGSGGGRPDGATAGAKDISKANEAIDAVDDILRSMLKSNN